MATDTNGDNYVVYLCRGKLCAQRVDARGNKLWETELEFGLDHGKDIKRNPAIAADGDGNFVVVWGSSLDDGREIYVQRLNANGEQAWEPSLRVNSDDGTNDNYSPDVAADDSGNIVVVWFDDRNGDFDIYAHKLNVNGEKQWSTDVRVNSDSGTANQGSSAVAMDDNGNVIVEACRSGSFIDVTQDGPTSISKHNRVVVSSTSSQLNAFPSAQGAYFSDAFWTAMGQNKDLKTAFEFGKQAVQATGMSQSPWLDDTGDAQMDGQDGFLASGRGLGSAFAGSPPVIDWVRVGGVVDGTATIQAQVRDDFNVSRVWVVIYPPDFVEPPPTQDGTTPEVNVPTEDLTLADTIRFDLDYSGFTQTGQYRLVVYAQDNDDNQALPQSLAVTNGNVLFLPLVMR